MSLDADSMAENAQIAYKMETVYFNERVSLWIEGGVLVSASLWPFRRHPYGTTGTQLRVPCSCVCKFVMF